MENYKKELDLAKEDVKKDNRLTALQKELLITTISCEALGSYSNGEFEESSNIYNQLGLRLDKEFIKIGKKSYSYFSWWFFKSTFEREMSLVSNLVLVNWFSLIEDNQELINMTETKESLEEIYLLHKNFLNFINSVERNMNIKELLNHQNIEGLNKIKSIWLKDEEIIEAVSNFLQSINQEKYLKTSFRNIFYYENEKWFKKTNIQKHKWKEKYEQYLNTK